MTEEDWDVFISHASEDKQEVAKPIADFLTSFGVRVWYDEFTLEPGDSLSRSIDKGLARSRFGLAVISPDFLQKDWPEYELRGLAAKELGHDKVVLPIWHNVDKEDVLEYSPPLADKLALKTEEQGIDQIGLQILGIVRPDLLKRLHARIAYEKAIEKAEIRHVNPKNIKPAPIRHEELPDDLIGRVRLVRAALVVPYPQTMEYWIDGFKRDINPYSEVEFWEHVAACFLEYRAIHQLTSEQNTVAFSCILQLLFGKDDATLEKQASELPEGSLSFLRNCCRSMMPTYEIRDLPSSVN